MKQPRGTIILDFDDTLFDTSSFKQGFLEVLESYGVSNELFNTTYYQTKDKYGVYIPLSHIDYLRQEYAISIPKDIFQKEEIIDTSKYVFHDVFSAIEELHSAGYSVILLSYGEIEFQKLKIHKSGIGDYFREEDIFVTEKPKEEIISAMDLVAPVYFINDKPAETYNVYEVFPQFTYILVKKNDNEEVFDGFTVVSEFPDAVSYIKNGLS